MKYKVTGSLTNASEQVLIDANGNISLGSGESKTAIQIIGSAASAFSVSGSIDGQSYEAVTSATVGDAISLVDTEKYNLLRINIDSHTGNSYTLYYKQI